MLSSRSGSSGHSAPVPPQSIEAVRRRARHRLIGAALLVLVGFIGFPLLFDTQPRPIAVDIPIEIPSRNTGGSTVSKGGQTQKEAPASKPKVSPAESLSPQEEVVASKPSAAPVEEPKAKATEKPASDAKQPTKPATEMAESDKPKPADKPAVKPTADAAPGTAAEKTVDKSTDKPADKPEGANERIVVQVGAFAEAQRAREARLTLERAGLKTYTHVAETAEGKRIRVRMGPFATRAEADKAAQKAKALGLPAALLWL